jgi:hypothetical protein
MVQDVSQANWFFLLGQFAGQFAGHFAGQYTGQFTGPFCRLFYPPFLFRNGNLPGRVY